MSKVKQNYENTDWPIFPANTYTMKPTHTIWLYTDNFQLNQQKTHPNNCTIILIAPIIEDDHNSLIERFEPFHFGHTLIVFDYSMPPIAAEISEKNPKKKHNSMSERGAVLMYIIVCWV